MKASHKQNKSKSPSSFSKLFKTMTGSTKVGKSKSSDSPAYDELVKMMDRVWEFTLKNSPIMATFMGVHEYDHLLSDFSKDAIEKECVFFENALKALNILVPDESAINHWNQQQKISYKVYFQYLELTSEQLKLKDYYSGLTSFQGPHNFLPMLFTKMPRTSLKEYSNIQKRMDAVPKFFDQVIDRLTEGLELKMTPSKTSVEGVPAQITAMMTVKDGVTVFHKVLEGFDKVCQGDEADALKILIDETIIKQIVPAYEKLFVFIKDEYLPNLSEAIGLEDRLPNGKETYAHKLRQYTTTRKTSQEIHDIGLSEVKRIRGEMARIANEAGFTGDNAVDEYSENIGKDPKYIAKTEKELLDAYRCASMIVYPKLPELFGKLPRTPFGIEAIPSYQAKDAAGAYYQGPTKNGDLGYRPGMFYANTYNIHDRKLYCVDALVLHEAIPGHHMQIALATENEGLHDIRKLARSIAYIEGWGLYAESLGKELGLYREPSSEFGRLNTEMLRACRLVVDTGMHSFGWSKKKAMDFMLENKAGTYTEIDAETTRYLSYPGQATAYKIGELKIHELRKMATEKLGEKFSIREFHDLILDVGSVPLTVLEDVVTEWVESK